MTPVMPNQMPQTPPAAMPQRPQGPPKPVSPLEEHAKGLHNLVDFIKSPVGIMILKLLSAKGGGMGVGQGPQGAPQGPQQPPQQ
jgi:hypothetical protein